MIKKKLSGTGVAIITPFTNDNVIDFKALDLIINNVIQNGVNYIVSLGTTGETPTLSKKEQEEIVKFTSEIIAKRVPLVVGAGGNNTEALCEHVGNFNFHDAVAILSASPYYNKPSQEGIYQHYTAFAEASPLPIILYNVPGRTGRNMDVDTVLKLSSNAKIIGIKEAAGDIQQCMDLMNVLQDDFLLLSGDDDLAAEQVAMGMDGVISVAANCYPGAFSDMITFAANKKTEDASAINTQLQECYNLLFVENNPAGVKAFLAEQGLIKNNLRLPLVPASQKLAEAIKAFVTEHSQLN